MRTSKFRVHETYRSADLAVPEVFLVINKKVGGKMANAQDRFLVINEARIAQKQRIQVNRGEILQEENEYDPANNEQEIGQYDLKRDFDIRKR